MSDYEDRVDGLNLKVVGPVDHIKPLPTVSFEKQGLKFASGVTLVKLS